MNDFDVPEHEEQCTPSVGGAGENPFKYQGPYKLDPNSPQAYTLGNVPTMTVREFAAFYCGIDESRADRQVYVTHINPLIRFVEKSIAESSHLFLF